MDLGYADPRRLHGPGRNARLLLDNARAVIAECLGVRSDEVTFTSSGTDAVHRGLLGLHTAHKRVGDTILVSAIEHSAVFEAARWATQVPGGGQSRSLPVDQQGLVLGEAIADARADGDARPTVAAIQLANPEVGVVQPIERLSAELGDVPLFMDACAATGVIPWPDGWAAAAASAHKWGGPAGIGLMVVPKGTRWRNPYPADDRIDPRVSGFENIPAALAAAAALQAVLGERHDTAARHHALSQQLRTSIADIEDLELISPDGSGNTPGLPHLVGFSCLYVDGEALVTALDKRGFGVASGSACTSSTLSPSHVLEAMGVLTHGNVRVSFGPDTQPEQVAAFSHALREVVSDLRNQVGLSR